MSICRGMVYIPPFVGIDGSTYIIVTATTTIIGILRIVQSQGNGIGCNIIKGSIEIWLVNNNVRRRNHFWYWRQGYIHPNTSVINHYETESRHCNSSALSMPRIKLPVPWTYKFCCTVDVQGQDIIQHKACDVCSHQFQFCIHRLLCVTTLTISISYSADISSIFIFSGDIIAIHVPPTIIIARP